MAVVIGSARADERHKYSGGAKGDQRQGDAPDYKGEVSLQGFYAHSKGWYILRPKNSKIANKIAKAMRTACNNKNIGYSQSDRYGVVKAGTAAKTKVNADCSSLVRTCVMEATGKDPGDFSTAGEAGALEDTGYFYSRRSYKNGTILYTGDVLVTKTKGHTVIVVNGADRIEDELKVACGTPVLKRGSDGEMVELLQHNLRELRFNGKNKKLPIADGEFGINTEYAVKNFQKAYGLVADGEYGPKSEAQMKKLIH